jgi:hypothetical protein
VPDDQPQPPSEGQRAEGSPQLAGERPQPADGTVKPGACGRAQAQPDAHPDTEDRTDTEARTDAEAQLNSEAQPNGDAPPDGEAQPNADLLPGEPHWLDDEDELSGLVLVPSSEPVPASRVLLPDPAAGPGGAGGELCWSFGVDLDALLAAAAKGMPGPGGTGMLPAPADAGHSDPAPGGAGRDQAAAMLLPEEGGLGVDVVAEYLPGSAGLAAWLDQRDPAQASDYDLPAVAAGWRRVAAFAQAREFAAVAQIAVRSAARNEKTGLEADGRPAAVTADAAAQVGLALALSPGTAEWWTSQAVTLTWRLPATGVALAAGEIDAYRARLITEATSLLDEDTARHVENDVLSEAGELTYAQLRSRLRRAVIIADPQGAEDRRKAAERRARVSLYPDDDGTATLTGTSLPAPHAAAAMARITALARALKASGAGGGTDLLRAHIYLGLLLGTLPPIPPPADGGQPSEPTDDDQPPDDPRDDGPGTPPGGGPSGPRGDDQPGSTPPGYGRPAGPPSGHGRSDDTPTGGGTGDGRPGSTPPRDGQSASTPSGAGPPGPRPPRLRSPGPEPPAAAPPDTGSASAASPGSPLPGSGTAAGTPADSGTAAGTPAGDVGGVADPWPEVPPLTDADAPSSDDGCTDPLPEPDDDDRLRYGEDPLDLPDTGPAAVWPSIPGITGTRPLNTAGAGIAGTPSTATGTAGTSSIPGRPAAGMLDLTLSWATFAESASAPGFLGRIGPVTAARARALAAAASTAPGTRWRVILTDDHGHAVKTAAVTRRAASRARPAHSPATRTGKAPARTTTPTAQAPATRDPAERPAAAGPVLPLAGPAASITGRVSVTIPAATLDHISAAELAGTSTRAAILRAAARAAARTRRQAAADQQSGNGCAHTTASPAYRPPATIRDFIEARDQTCRFPGCRQPAWRSDLDHTTPYHHGGPTCPCNLGPLCRRHHQLKQQQHWTLTQTQPGTFRWKTPAGRSYTTTAHQHTP